MADDTSKLPDVGDKQVKGDEPEGYAEFAANMAHYAKSHEWVEYAMQCYQQNQSGTTDTTQPATPAAKGQDMAVERMQRDDEAVNYARLTAQVAELTKARESDRETIATLAKERDEAQCERMIRTLQAQGYHLQDSTETLVKELVEETPAARQKWEATIRKYSVPTPNGQLIEAYSGKLEEPGKGVTVFTAEMAGKAANYAAGDTKKWEKARSALLAGQAIED